MSLHEVLPALIAGKDIRRKGDDLLHYKIGKSADGPILVFYTPYGTAAAISTTFDIADVLATDWEVVP